MLPLFPLHVCPISRDLPRRPCGTGKAELSALTHLSGVELDEEVFDVLVELTRLGVVPTAVNQVLKSLASVAAKQPPRQ